MVHFFHDCEQEIPNTFQNLGEGHGSQKIYKVPITFEYFLVSSLRLSLQLVSFFKKIRNFKLGQNFGLVA